MFLVGGGGDTPSHTQIKIVTPFLESLLLFSLSLSNIYDLIIVIMVVTFMSTLNWNWSWRGSGIQHTHEWVISHKLNLSARLSGIGISLRVNAMST